MIISRTCPWSAFLFAVFLGISIPQAEAQSTGTNISTFQGTYNFVTTATKISGTEASGRSYTGRVKISAQGKITGRVKRIEKVTNISTGEDIQNTKSQVRISGRIGSFNQLVRGGKKMFTVVTNLTFSDGLSSEFVIVNVRSNKLDATSGSGKISSDGFSGTVNLTKR